MSLRKREIRNPHSFLDKISEILSLISVSCFISKRYSESGSSDSGSGSG
jgi:hypothetical protein